MKLCLLEEDPQEGFPFGFGLLERAMKTREPPSLRHLGKGKLGGVQFRARVVRWLLDQTLRRDTEMFVDRPDHLEGQGRFPLSTSETLDLLPI